MLTAKLWTKHRIPSGGIRERTEGTEVQSHRKSKNINQSDPRELPGMETNNQGVHGVTRALATYVAKDSLVYHQWERRPLVQ